MFTLVCVDEGIQSYEKNLLQYPQYTRPNNFKGFKIPPVLTSGDHDKIKKWRLEQSKIITKKNRPDLFKI